MVPDNLAVGRYRAIMTTQDRARIAGESDEPEDKRYQAISRVRYRIEELAEDAELLRENHEELYKELQEAVCDD